MLHRLVGVSVIQGTLIMSDRLKDYRYMVIGDEQHS